MTGIPSSHTAFAPPSPAASASDTLFRDETELVRLYRENKLKPGTDLFKRARERHLDLKHEDRIAQYRRDRHRQSIQRKITEYWARYRRDVLRALLHFAWIICVYLYLKQNLGDIIDTAFPMFVALIGK